jgi:hypothetical protein
MESMKFSKEELEYHYTWTDGTQTASLTGSPSRRLFNRFDGNQVLFIINHFARMNADFSQEDGRRIENLIVKQLPLDAKSEISVCNWLETVLKSAPSESIPK